MISNLPIVVTTSDRYHHLIPIFCYLFNKNWGEYPIELVGYKKPDFKLPDNFTFHSMGSQTEVNQFSIDLKRYFSKRSEWFIWLFEDCFIKEVDHELLNKSMQLIKRGKVGRVNLTRCGLSQDYEDTKPLGDLQVYENTQSSNYRLSTQPSIWNREFVIKYMRPYLTPWMFETQSAVDDGYRILGLHNAPVSHNEGVRKDNIFKYDLAGIKEEQLEEMKQLNIL